MAARNDGDGLADFVRGLPDGQRHKGFYWAAATAAEDGLPPGEVAKVAQAGIDAGLDKSYVQRTITEAGHHGEADTQEEA